MAPGAFNTPPGSSLLLTLPSLLLSEIPPIRRIFAVSHRRLTSTLIPSPVRNRRGRSLKNDNVPLSSLLEGLANGGGKNGKPEVGLFQAKRRKDRLKPFKFGPSELAELAVGLRAYVTAKRETSAPVTSWSNLLARKWPREYALAKQAAGFKCTAQKVREAIDANLLNRYGSVWQWRGGWPAEAEKYPACTI
tara:strand:- start:270 stop:845 length:576 start_codon:yes stop_codon:yes gene_type:complete